MYITEDKTIQVLTIIKKNSRKDMIGISNNLGQHRQYRKMIELLKSRLDVKESFKDVVYCTLLLKLKISA